MADIAEPRKQRLRTLENQIRKNYEAFVATGFALKEIRDDELYKEDGFESWESYLKDRVGEEFGIEARQARNLIACAQVRTKLPDNSGSTLPEGDGWSQRELLEFARLAPKSEDHGQPWDFDKLKKQDVQRVAKKVIQYCEEQETTPTSTIVRKFVDEELGIDRSAQSQETKKQREEESRPVLHRFLEDMLGRIEAEKDLLLENVDEDGWKLLRGEHPGLVKRLTAACESLADLFRRCGR